MGTDFCILLILNYTISVIPKRIDRELWGLSCGRGFQFVRKENLSRGLPSLSFQKGHFGFFFF